VNITVVGTGYVGLVVGTCLADLGYNVTCLDIDKTKIRRLKKGEIIIFEPGLKDIFDYNILEKRLFFSSNVSESLRCGDVIFIAVGTPPGKDFRADISSVKHVAAEIGKTLDRYKVIVIKSTVPVGTSDQVKKIIKKYTKKGAEFDVVSNPEFLREGFAVKDFMNPDRIVVGVDSPKAEEIMRSIYNNIARTGKPILFTNIRSSEMIKYASNAFLATKISFINEMSRLCEKVGADVKEVAKGMGLDERIGPRFLQAGAGYGGSCFPKDVKALLYNSQKYGAKFRILEAVEQVNHEQRKIIVKKIQSVYKSLKNRRIAIWGLAFKPLTDDMREAPSVSIIEKLQSLGAKITAFDPVARGNAKKVLKNVLYKDDPYSTVKGCDALIIVTEWNVFRELDFERIKLLMRKPVIIDGRNIYEPNKMRSLGYIYMGVGR